MLKKKKFYHLFSFTHPNGFLYHAVFIQNGYYNVYDLLKHVNVNVKWDSGKQRL